MECECAIGEAHGNHGLLGCKWASGVQRSIWCLFPELFHVFQ
jgi:hypothetical protein